MDMASRRAFARASLGFVLALAGCAASAGDESQSEPGAGGTPTGDVEGTPIVFFIEDEGMAQLRADMEAGDVPVECNVLYDEMGGRPEVVVTDPDTIAELYDRLSRMIVLQESDMSITDSYHHIYFTLRDGTRAGCSFEGRELLALGRENYAVSDEGDLWDMVRGLQDEAMEEGGYQGGGS